MIQKCDGQLSEYVQTPSGTMTLTTNIVLNAFLLFFLTIFVIHYVISHFDVISQWQVTVCDNECLNTYFSGPPKSLRDPTLLSLVRESYLDPPPPKPDVEPFDIYRPIWRKLVDWYKVQENLYEVWRDQFPGRFVEIGAADGEFMSQTIMLEKNLSWTGLLIEPDPRSYKIMRERKRNAWTSPLCVHYELPSPKKASLNTKYIGEASYANCKNRHSLRLD
ncbi:hypothetical protein SK128_009515 [Halocaridina rubra]|uniref:Methyltransferase n=1 Tax=Halocaridina rubra TaxID=373956 RepID=A0AAN8WNG2_HALRR